jgi:hypothetical protein
MSGRPNGQGQIGTNPFLNAANYNKIMGFLRGRYTKKMGVSVLPERMDTKLQNYVKYYMGEVTRVQGQDKPLNTLAGEVLRETEQSMEAWLNKQKAAVPPTTTSIGAFPKVDENRLFQDNATRFETILAERAPAPLPQIGIPDFRALNRVVDEEEDPVLLMQRAQKERDNQIGARNLNGGTLGMAAGSEMTAKVKDDGNIILQPEYRVAPEKAQPTSASPIPSQADPPPPLLALRPQDYIIPQEDVVKYRETEFNIFLSSGDRDWLRNTTENRYNFSVIFNAGKNSNGYNFNPAIQERFRNIQRVEFVKAIIPTESLTSLVRVTGAGPVYDTSRVVNVMSLPFASVRIAELNNNGFSTNPDEDNSFSIVQYDTTWNSTTNVPGSYVYAPTANESNVPFSQVGFTGFIPKFLRTQRVYAPTPLATLNKLTIRMERHDSQLISDTSDVLQIARLQLSDSLGNIGAASGGTSVVDNTNYSSATATGAENPYIFLLTSQYFLFSAVSEGDIINIQGFSVAPSGNTLPGTCIDFANYINQPTGQYVVATGYATTTAGVTTLNLGRNNAGYCNLIILRNRFNDPATTGGTQRNLVYFGGALTQEQVGTAPLGPWTDGLVYILNQSTTIQTNCALINTSRQTQFVLRIVTRDFDPASNIRPDNV